MEDLKAAKRRKKRSSGQDILLNSTGTMMRNTQNSVIFSKHADADGIHHHMASDYQGAKQTQLGS